MKNAFVVTLGLLLGMAPATGPVRNGELTDRETAPMLEAPGPWTVSAGGKPVRVYTALVVASAEKRRAWMGAEAGAAAGAGDGREWRRPETCWFANVSAGDVVVECPEVVREVKVLPASEGGTAVAEGKTVRVRLPGVGQYVVEVNGDIYQSLALFVNPPETPAQEGASGVKYFGPGVHEVKEPIVVGDGETLYLAEGAILRATMQDKGPAVVQVTGKGACVRGRGILDGTLLPLHTRNLMMVTGQDCRIEGITVHDSSTWTIPIRRADRVTVENVKIFGFRPNSDGIDICNSREVAVKHCFIRTWDDLVVVKSDKGQGAVRGVDVSNCVLFNQVAHALSIGAELREEVSDVVFHDCEVIHDIGREWTLRIFHSDSATVHDVTFRNIHVGDCKRLISVWVDKAVWSRDAARGFVRDVVFENIAADVPKAKVELHQPADAAAGEPHVTGVVMKNVTLAGRPLTVGEVSVSKGLAAPKVVPKAEP